MKVEPFAMERFQSTWEPTVAYNLADSGIHPLTLGELIEDARLRQDLNREPLGYGYTNGSAELRAAIAELHTGARSDEVLVTSGTAEANFLVTWALSDPGDEFVVMLPNYMQVPQLARSWGVTVCPWHLRESDGWAPDVDALETLLTPRTKAIFVCNPNNPTGAVLSSTVMDAICAAAARVEAWVVADEVYRGAEVDGPRTPSFWGRYPRVMVTGGLSKAYGLPGLRIGWILAPAQLTERLWGYHDYTTIAPNVLGDRLARAALRPEVQSRLAVRTRAILSANLSLLRDWLTGLEGRVTAILPRAGAICFARYVAAINSTALATRLRIEHNVLVVPGDHFNMDGYLRIGCGGQPDILEEGLRRIRQLFEVVLIGR